MCLVSVIIPLFNKEDYIERTLQSVLAQTFTDFEVIVVDDGSTDQSVERVKALTDKRIIVVATKERRGVSAARNRGIQEASGELIAFLDADDTWKPTFLETILSLQTTFPAARAFATNYEIVLPSGECLLPNEEWNAVYGERFLLTEYVSFLCGALPITASSVVIKKELLVEVGGFLEGESLGEDQELWLRIADNGPIAYALSREMTYYRGLPNSACADTSNVQPYAITKAVKAKLAAGVTENERAHLEHYLLKLELDYAKRLHEANKTTEAICYTAKTLKWWGIV